MTIIKNEHGYKGQLDFHADVPLIKAPKIISEKMLHGVRYYFTDNGKQFLADTYDKMFRCVQKKIKGKYHKGNLIGKAAWR